MPPDGVTGGPGVVEVVIGPDGGSAAEVAATVRAVDRAGPTTSRAILAVGSVDGSDRASGAGVSGGSGASVVGGRRPVDTVGRVSRSRSRAISAVGSVDATVAATPRVAADASGVGMTAGRHPVDDSGVAAAAAAATVGTVTCTEPPAVGAARAVGSVDASVASMSRAATDAAGNAAAAGGCAGGGGGGTAGDAPSSDDGGDSSDGSSSSGSAESDGGDDAVADVGNGELPTSELRARLRAAIDRAHVRAGRLSDADKAVAETLAVMTARAVRRARMQAAQPAARFPWRHVVRQQEAPTVEPVVALTQVCGDAEHAKRLLEEPALPDRPPSPEAEAEGEDGAAPPPLPQSSAWWQEERARQATKAFEAGVQGDVGLRFKEGERPIPPPGVYFRWGQVLRTEGMSTDARMDLARLLAKDLRSGAISLVADSEVDCVTPVFIVYHPVTLKARLVHDLRAVNARLVAASAHLPRVTEALAGLPYAAKLDLAQAFRHVGVRPEDRRVMAFQINDLTFRWNALPFGSGQSPALFAAALADCLRKLPASMKVVVYVDDILVLGETREQLDANFLALCKTLRGGGWTVALEKCYPYAHSKIPFLGLLVKLGPGTQHLLVSKAKATRLRDLCTFALGLVSVSLRDLQRISGLLAFFGLAAPEARLGRKGIDAAAAEAERLPGRTVGVKGALRADLELWKEQAVYLPTLPPMPVGDESEVIVCTDAAGLPSLGFGGIVWAANTAAPDIDAVLGSPSDYKKRFRADVKSGAARVFSGPLPDASASLSSAALEVQAFRKVLGLRHGRSSLKGATIRWYCDSMSAVMSVSAWRSKSPGLARELRLLLDDCRRMGCRVVPHWVARDLGWQPIADALSKMQWRRNSAEWFVSREWFGKLSAQAGWRPTRDLFAAPGNNVADAYCTEFPTPGAWTNAFGMSWSGSRAWAFPPFSAADAMFRHLCRASNARMLTIVPSVARVPPRLRVVSRRPVPSDLRLRDPEGQEAWGPCPTPLDIVDVCTLDFVDG